jgi:hypothetical protein
MNPIAKGLLVAAIHAALILSLGGKLLLDRRTYPRVWAKAVPYDPQTPIRGRYVSLQLEVRFPVVVPSPPAFDNYVSLSVEGGQLTARVSNVDTGVRVMPDGWRRTRLGVSAATTTATPVILPPVAYFIPDNVPDPSRRAPGEELWVEVTLPKKGPPRPIQLGVKKDGKITPLNLN